MPAEIIVFSNRIPARLEKVELNPFKCDLTREAKEGQFSVLCLFDQCWLPEMKRNTTQFEYKKIKISGKELTHYFSDTGEKFPFVDGRNYSRYRSLKSSINKVLMNIDHEKRFSLHFLAVSEDLFKEAKQHVIKTSLQTEVRKGGYNHPLLNMLEPIDRDKSLKIRYFGNSESCMLVRQEIAKASENDLSVLILGETGTGKEVVARNIHECSERSSHPFISINCSAIATDLFESEIFGHKKGAFTGATSDKDGLWKLADKGTLFLDEIGDLSLNHQSKILRALEENKIQPVGATKKVGVDVRIVAATNKNIEPSGTNSFREDLYYRISTLVIHTPPLRNHTEDIPLMAQKYWTERFRAKLSQDVLNHLKYINWPGNVRTLEKFLERLHAFFGKGTITIEQIQVLRDQEMENYLNASQDKASGQKQASDKDFEKAIIKMEFLLKAALYCEDTGQRNGLLKEVKESLKEVI